MPIDPMSWICWRQCMVLGVVKPSTIVDPADIKGVMIARLELAVCSGITLKCVNDPLKKLIHLSTYDFIEKNDMVFVSEDLESCSKQSIAFIIES
uniref:Uncharacterized protein n=1 Tax=Solanum lycopersicum TaxID=4081 RepID=A0A3Q7GJK8_SOLLC